MTSLRPIARVALTALAIFGTTDAEQARTLLDLWGRRNEMTDADVSAVLAAFDPPATDFDRDMTTPPGGPLPTGVHGYAVTGRDAR
jgi:hypothetical protein